MTEAPVIIIKDSPIEVMIPDCCKEGWEDCRHVAKKERKQKQNIGL